MAWVLFYCEEKGYTVKKRNGYTIKICIFCYKIYILGGDTGRSIKCKEMCKGWRIKDCTGTQIILLLTCSTQTTRQRWEVFIKRHLILGFCSTCLKTVPCEEICKCNEGPRSCRPNSNEHYVWGRYVSCCLYYGTLFSILINIIYYMNWLQYNTN